MVLGRWAGVLSLWVMIAAWPKAYAEEESADFDAPPPEPAATAPAAAETAPAAPPPVEASATEEATTTEAAATEAAEPAQEPPPVAQSVNYSEPPADEAPEPPRKRYSADVLSFDKWENALDLKMTSMFNRNALDFTSPTVLLTAEWNYRFRGDGYLGLSLSGAPQKATVQLSDGTSGSYTTYYGGLVAGQALYNRSQMRAVIQVTAGAGVVYVRRTPVDSASSTIEKPQYTLIEPGIFFTFYEYSGLDIGAVFTYRYAKLITASQVVHDKDVRSMTFGLTFRSRHH